MSRTPTHPWPAFAAAAFAFLVAMAGTTLPTPIYAIYSQVFGTAQVTVTVIYAVYAAGVIGALLLTGTWSDQIGRKPLLAAGLAFSAASAVCFVFASGLWWLLVGRVLSGLSAGLFAGTATAALMDLVPKGRERIGVLTATAANMGGLGLGPILSGVVVSTLPAPMVAPYLVHLVLVAVAGALFWRVPETVARVARPVLSPQRPTLPHGMAGVFVPAAMVATAGFMVTGFYSAVVPAFLAKEMGYHSHLLVGLVVGALFLCSTLGQVLDQILPGQSHLRLGCAVLGAGAALIGAGFLAASLGVLLAGTLVAGVGHGLAFRSGLGAVGHAAPPERRGGTIALYFVVSYLAISVPVVLTGVLGLMIPLRPLSIGFAAVACALGLLAWARVPARS